MALESHSDDLNAWPPPEYDQAQWNLGWTRVFQETQGMLAMECPEHSDAICHVNEGHLILQFGKDKGSVLSIQHGIWIPFGKRHLPLYLSKKASLEILNALNPKQRIALAREMTRTRIMEVQDERDEALMQGEQGEEDEDGNDAWRASLDEPSMDFSAAVPELAAWKEDDTYEEDFLDPEERDREEELNEIVDMAADENLENDPHFQELANEDPILQKLYFSFLKGRIDPNA